MSCLICNFSKSGYWENFYSLDRSPPRLSILIKLVRHSTIDSIYYKFRRNASYAGIPDWVTNILGISAARHLMVGFQYPTIRCFTAEVLECQIDFLVSQEFLKC